MGLPVSQVLSVVSDGTNVLAGATGVAVPASALLAGVLATAATQTYTAGNHQGLAVELSGNLRVVCRPVDVGALGSYSVTTTSGLVAAGMAGGVAVWAFRTGGSNSYIVRRVSVAMWDVTTAFTAGLGQLSLFVGRGFTASYTTNGAAATLTGNNGKKKTGFATTGVAQIYTLSTSATGITGATVTLDNQPVGTVTFPVSATANAVMQPSVDLVNYVGMAASWPLVLGANEGLVNKATVPATGTWTFQVTVEWDEVVTAP